MSKPDHPLARLEALCLALSQRLALVSVLGMLILSLLTMADVTLRYVGNFPIPGFYDAMHLLMVVIISACLPAGMALRKNLVVDVLRERIGETADALLTAIGGFVLLAFQAIVAWRFVIYTTVLQDRHETTLIAGIPAAPFWWCATAALFLCLPPQIVIVCRQVLEAIRILRGREAAPNGPAEPPKRAENANRDAWLKVAVAGGATALTYVLMFKAAASGWMIGLAIFGFLALWLPAIFLVPLGAAMGVAGLVGTALLIGWPPALDALALKSAAFLGSIDLAVLPLFLMMGSFSSAAGMSTDLYRLAHALFGHLRGGLAIATIGACAGFGALTGSSLATAATIGRLSLPEMRKYGYSKELAAGTVAAGGTLGQLVPPAHMLVLYAVLSETSIGRLFMATIVPGILAAVLYILTIAVITRLSPRAAPETTSKVSRGELFAALQGSWTILLMYGLVFGGIYAGIFTVTESAAVGAGLAFLFAWWRGSLSGGKIWEVFGEVASNTAFIYLLLFGTMIFTFFIGVTQLPNILVDSVSTWNVHPLVIIALIAVIYIVLGCVMESITVMLISVPVVVPLILSLGYDPIWWGIITVVIVEIGVLTPPIGINCFMIRTLAPDISLATIFRGVMPFVASSIFKLGLLILFPALTLWLPQQMMR